MAQRSRAHGYEDALSVRSGPVPGGAPHGSEGMSAPNIELRFARPGEADVVGRLAELDSAPALTGQIMIALVDCEAVAGLSLLDQRIVANPFVPTHEAVELLQLRAGHLSGTRTHRNVGQALLDDRPGSKYLACVGRLQRLTHRTRRGVRATAQAAPRR
jgi:hypothetical protein